MNRFNEKDAVRDFQLFMQKSEIPPSSLSQSIFSRIANDLNPSSFKVFSKLGTIQIVVGLVTLVFCPQLGVGPLIGEHGIMMLFMHYGPVVCAATCGLIFFGASILLASLAMRPEELRKIQNRHLVGIPILSALSLILLMLLGGSGTFVIYAAWILGAIIGGEISSKAVIYSKFRKMAA